MKMTKIAALLVTAAALMVSQAGATVVFSYSGGTPQTMPALEYFGPGPQTFGSPTITWSSTNATMQGGSVFGYNEGYGFLANGFWDAGVGTMAGVNDSFAAYGVTDTMTFAFSSPVSSVGGFFNYVPGGPTPTTIAVWDSSMHLIESYNLTFLTNGTTDSGQNIGFIDPGIAYFTMTDNYVAIAQMVTNFSTTPEPSSLLLMGSGALGLAGLLRRKFNV